MTINKKGMTLIETIGSIFIVSTVIMVTVGFIFNSRRISLINDYKYMAQAHGTNIAQIMKYDFDFDTLYDALGDRSHLIFDDECKTIYPTLEATCDSLFDGILNNIEYDESKVSIYVYQFNNYNNTSSKIYNDDDLSENFRNYVYNDLNWPASTSKSEDFLRVSIVIDYFDGREVIINDSKINSIQ